MLKNLSFPSLGLALIFSAACTTTQQNPNLQSESKVLAGRDVDIELDVQGAEVISDGWIEYKVALKNHGAKSVNQLTFILTDEDDATHQAATSPEQLQQLPSGMNAAVAYAGARAVLPSLMMMGVPFIGPMLMAGSSIGSAYSSDQAVRMESVRQRFSSISLTGRDLYANDELIGSLFFPAVIPASVKIGFIKDGRREWAFIGSARPDVNPIVVARSSHTISDPMTAEVQTLLNQLGYPCGAADGISGPKTREAVKRYQIDNGLPADGVVSQELLASLRNGV